MTTVTKIKQFFNQLECVGLKCQRESNKGSDLKTGYLGDSEASGDFYYLRTRRRWSRILFPSGTEESSYYGGIALKLLVSQEKCDLQICDLPCCHDTPSISKEEKTIVVVPTFYSESCEMADHKASRCQPGKSKAASGNVVSRLFRRLSPTKSFRGDEISGSSSSSTTQASESRKKYFLAKENSSCEEDVHSKKLTKSSLNQSESISSSNSSLSQPTPPWISPALSYQSLNQDKQATELKLLSQLNTNFEENTNILGNYISLLDRKK